MNLSDFRIIRLQPDTDILPFDCGDDDLNDFLLNEAKNYLNQLIAVTYLIESDERTLAFWSLFNDKIVKEPEQSNNAWRRFRELMFPQNKQFISYPSMKIGRLGVDNTAKGHGLGTQILDYLKIWFVDNNRTGCRFITVDAYAESLKFYEKNGFKYLTETDKGKDTRLMYYDLIEIKNALGV
jgi:GNAT superfamily N-acetyltransferase